MATETPVEHERILLVMNCLFAMYLRQMNVQHRLWGILEKI